MLSAAIKNIKEAILDTTDGNRPYLQFSLNTIIKYNGCIAVVLNFNSYIYEQTKFNNRQEKRRQG